MCFRKQHLALCKEYQYFEYSELTYVIEMTEFFNLSSPFLMTNSNVFIAILLRQQQTATSQSNAQQQFVQLDTRILPSRTHGKSAVSSGKSCKAYCVDPVPYTSHHPALSLSFHPIHRCQCNVQARQFRSEASPPYDNSMPHNLCRPPRYPSGFYCRQSCNL